MEMDRRAMTASELARLAKVPQPTIFRILSGETNDPRIGTVDRIKRILGGEHLPALVENQDDFTEHIGLINKWRLLLPTEQDALMKQINAKATHNEAVLKRIAPKTAKAQVIPPPRKYADERVPEPNDIDHQRMLNRRAKRERRLMENQVEVDRRLAERRAENEK